MSTNVINGYWMARGQRDRALRGLLSRPVGTWRAKDFRALEATWPKALAATTALIDSLWRADDPAGKVVKNGAAKFQTAVRMTTEAA
jgi:hypothetical protein